MAARAKPAYRVLGLPRQYLAQGRADDILASLGLDGPGVAESVRQARLGTGRTAASLNGTGRSGTVRAGQARLAPFCRTKSLTA